MKKSLVLGAAALAAVAMAPPPADAGEVKMGGYYMFRMQNADSDLDRNLAGDDDRETWFQRIQINMDFIASEKSHAHMKVRVLDSAPVQGAGPGARVGQVTSTDSNGDTTTNPDGGEWDVRQLWLETEMASINVKVGEMPIALNDEILVNENSAFGGFGAIVLSKSFGGLTIVAADVRLVEGNVSGASANAGAGQGASDDDVDLYVLSLLGKAGTMHYQLTGAWADGQNDAGLAGTAAGTDNENWWLASTLGADMGGTKLTATAIWESGWENSTAGGQLQQDGFLVALRAKAKAGFGGWNAYGVYATEDFNNIVSGEAKWSKTWDQGGTGGQDLMKNWAAALGSNVTMTSNIWSVGAGLTINAAGWKINPMVDYAAVVDEDPTNTGATTVVSDSIWGGTLQLSTKVQAGTTVGIEAAWVNPSSTAIAGANAVDKMHYVQATLKMVF